jgi:hypothetical protein
MIEKYRRASEDHINKHKQESSHLRKLEENALQAYGKLSFKQNEVKFWRQQQQLTYDQFPNLELKDRSSLTSPMLRSERKKPSKFIKRRERIETRLELNRLTAVNSLETTKHIYLPLENHLHSYERYSSDQSGSKLKKKNKLSASGEQCLPIND